MSKRFSREHAAHLFVAQVARRDMRAGDFHYATNGDANGFKSAANVDTDQRQAQPLALSGNGNVVAATPTAAPGTLTPFQRVVIACCHAVGLPEPACEFRFHPRRLWRFDFAWVEQLVYLEVEGGLWTNGRHSRGAGAIADLEKYSEAAILGWRGLYCTPSDVKRHGLDRVRRALA